MPAPSLAASKLAVLRAEAPERWRRKVRAAIRKARSLTVAAAALGVGARTLQGWVVAEPALVDGIELRKVGRPRVEG